jgi:hypothetical protein
MSSFMRLEKLFSSFRFRRYSDEDLVMASTGQSAYSQEKSIPAKCGI